MRKLPVNLLCAILICTGVLCAQTRQLTEAEALSAVRLATNPTTKLAAAEEFVKRFPRSKHRLEIADLIAGEILNVRNGTVAITLVERAQSVFTAEDEREIFKRVALDAYAAGDRPDEAFKLAAELLAKDPDDLYVLWDMAKLGANQATKRKRDYADLALQYGLKAIAILESGKRPEKIDPMNWGALTSHAGQVYQHVAVLYLGAGDTEKPKTLLQKAIASEPYNPTHFALYGRVLQGDYEKDRAAYDALPEGPQKQEALKKREEVLDHIIDAYARVVGISRGRQELQLLAQQVIPDLTRYYKDRNNQSTKGLQELIDQYKPR